MPRLMERGARLELERGEAGLMIRAAVPPKMSEPEFTRVATSIYGLIHNLTGCNCLSGRISVIVEDDFSEVINVNFEEGAAVGR